jgi:hypothetical protein
MNDQANNEAVCCTHEYVFLIDSEREVLLAV